jgi:hypothetical protein
LQIKAFIFSLCTLFYWVESTAAPRMMNPSTATPSANTHACCHEGASSQGQCQEAAKKQCPKEKGCPTSEGCFNCPLCFTAILPVLTQHTEAKQSRQEYNLWISSYVYTYPSSCWKPPNAA